MSYEVERRTIIERKRNILYLISKYLSDIGLDETNQILINESRLSQDYTICDNIDLESIYLEFSSYYQLKFGKNPKILKKNTTQGTAAGGGGECSGYSIAINGLINNGSTRSSSKSACNLKPKSKTERGDKTTLRNSLDDSLTINQFANNSELVMKKNVMPAVVEPPTLINDYISTNFNFINLNLDNYPAEYKDLASTVCADIVKSDLNVRWTNVFGADHVISILKEGIILPLEYPQLFDGVTSPWRSVLMHGPPGCGKTLIAKALCSETLGKITFFNVSPSTITSKWRGESEKMIRILFHVAKQYAPSIIFIDEIECLTSQRDKMLEHEASKRFKNEFLGLMDGLESEHSGIFILAATNLPWEIDHAFLRRFEKKIMLNLPNPSERTAMIRKCLDNVKISNETVDELGKFSHGFSGDEIRIACKEIKMIEIRQKIKSPTKGKELSVINSTDALAAFKQVNPISLGIMKKHKDWDQKYDN